MRIFVVDDQELFRNGLVNMLQSQNDMTVVGEASSVREAIKKILGVKPDLVLMDLVLPDGDGLQAMKAVLAHLPQTRVVILTGHDSNDTILLAFLNGAKGYILKSMHISKLLVSLRAVARGEIALSRAMTGRVLEELTRMMTVTNPPQVNLNNLTSRELDVFKLLGTGISNRQIAEYLVIAENTVKIHIHNIYEKLKLRNRQEAVRLAQRMGLVNGTNGVRSSQEEEHISTTGGVHGNPADL